MEIKPPGDCAFVTRTIETLRRSMRAPWVIQSFDPLNLRLASWVDLSIQITMLVETAGDFDHAIRDRWPAIAAKHTLINEARAGEIHSYGGKVGAWTVNEPPDIERMFSLGVDTLITDRPLLARKLQMSRARSAAE